MTGVMCQNNRSVKFKSILSILRWVLGFLKMSRFIEASRRQSMNISRRRCLLVEENAKEESKASQVLRRNRRHLCKSEYLKWSK